MNFGLDGYDAYMHKKVNALWEQDPNGLSPKEQGAKLDAGKPRVGMVLGGFAKALLEVAKVGTHGLSKYSKDGWKHVENGEERYTDAMLRHWFAEQSEYSDKDSGLAHASHLAWNSLARLEFMLNADIGHNGINSQLIGGLQPALGVCEKCSQRFLYEDIIFTFGVCGDRQFCKACYGEFTSQPTEESQQPPTTSRPQ